MLIKHFNPISLYKLLKTPQEMRTLLTYLKVMLFDISVKQQFKEEFEGINYEKGDLT